MNVHFDENSDDSPLIKCDGPGICKRHSLRLYELTEEMVVKLEEAIKILFEVDDIFTEQDVRVYGENDDHDA